MHKTAAESRASRATREDGAARPPMLRSTGQRPCLSRAAGRALPERATTERTVSARCSPPSVAAARRSSARATSTLVRSLRSMEERRPARQQRVARLAEQTIAPSPRWAPLSGARRAHEERALVASSQRLPVGCQRVLWALPDAVPKAQCAPWLLLPTGLVDEMRAFAMFGMHSNNGDFDFLMA